MYNIDFLPQLETSRRSLFGAGVDSIDSRGAPHDTSAGYSPPAGVRVVECEEAPNGEWVPTSPNPVIKAREDLPAPEALEGRADSE
jgi:hypothetical protein